jgi:16S rRNA (guanine966-N2)-methyltransferase
VRIIGGAWRGRRLASLGKGDAAAHLRPTSDRVRESLFNVLSSSYGDHLQDARVLDLFAGTGALGLEALSRGAAEAVFVENGRTGLKLLRENIRALGAQAQAQVLARDASRLGPVAQPCDLIFLDPPYGKTLGERALTSAQVGGWIAPGALVVWEENTEVAAPEWLGLLDARRYGDTVIRVFEADTASGRCS